jgi:hypothetical protein
MKLEIYLRTGAMELVCFGVVAVVCSYDAKTLDRLGY